MKTGESTQHHPHPYPVTKTALGLVMCITLSFIIGWHAKPTDDDEILARPSVYFSPEGGVKQALLENIRQAREEILVALYYFTDPDLADALIEAHQKGVRVQIILDKSQRNGKYSQARKLSDAGLDVVFDSRHRIFHHKFMVIDRSMVVTGSQNWTKSAEHHNAENILLLRDEKITNQYISQFTHLIGLHDKAWHDSSQTCSLSIQGSPP